MLELKHLLLYLHRRSGTKGGLKPLPMVLRDRGHKVLYISTQTPETRVLALPGKAILPQLILAKFALDIPVRSLGIRTYRMDFVSLMEICKLDSSQQ